MENLGRVVLLMGGVSSEREVSLMSGEGVHKALVSKGVDVLKFDPKTDSLETLEKGGFDRAFIALHGRLGEDGTIQGVLNYLGIPYTGPGVTASAMAIDKDLTKRVWRSAGIPVPEGVMIDPKADDAVLEEAIACLGATGLVVKPTTVPRLASPSSPSRPSPPSERRLRTLRASAATRCLSRSTFTAGSSRSPCLTVVRFP